MTKNNKRFIKGVSASPETQFKKGQHWRVPQKFREKEWLNQHYCIEKISTGEIAKMFGVTDSAILFWMRKHGIKRRTVSESRAIKHWGCSGTDNPMWNKRGKLNPRWLGGITPERQEFYTSQEWKNACYDVWKRDNATCQRCGVVKGDNGCIPFHVHHIVGFADKELRADVSNLVLLCEACHLFIHSKRNTTNELIQKV